MDEITKYREWVTACVERMDAILAAAQQETRDLTADEEAEYTRLDGSVEQSRKMVEKLTRTANLRDNLNQPQRTINFGANIVKTLSADEKEFKNIGEFLFLMRFDPNNRKLAEYREQSFSVGSEGGLMIPAKFMPDIKKIEADTALFRPRAQVIPAGDPPDAEITIPVLDQNTNMYGGIVMYKMAEGASTTESSATLKDFSMKPQGVGGHVVLTNKLLRNWQAAGPFVTNLMGGAKVYYEDMQFLSGNGVAGPTGLIGHKACKVVSRAGAGAISFTDIVNMYSVALQSGGPYVWVTSQTTLPQLCAIADAGSNNLWMPSAVAGTPNTLMGLPVLFHGRIPGLGSEGDLMLVNLFYYLIKDGSGPYVRVSDQVYFLNDKTVFQMIWNIDGRPWLEAPIALEGSTSNTVSPFVVLK